MVHLPAWYTEQLTLQEALKLSPTKWLGIATFRNLRNHLLLSGGVSFLLYLFPRLHVKFLGCESLIGLLLWRFKNFLYVGLSALTVNPLTFMAFRSLSAAIPAAPGSDAARYAAAPNAASKALRWFFSVVRGGSGKIPSATTNWGFQFTICLNWLPAMKWAKIIGPLSRVQSVDTSPLSATAAVAYCNLTPEAFFLTDLVTSAGDRIAVAACNRLFPALGLLPSSKPSNRIFFKKVLSQVCGAVLAYVIVARGLVPHVRLLGWNFIDPVRDAPTVQSLLCVFIDSMLDFMLSKTSYMLRDRPDRTISGPTDPLTPEESALVERVAQVYNVSARNFEEMEQAFADVAISPTLTASERVTLCTIVWAVQKMEREVAAGKLCKSALQKYAAHLRRYNHQLDEEFELRQESSVLLCESSSVVAPRPGSVEEQSTYTCSVCLGRLTLTQDVLEITHCRHKFHAECVARWLQKSSQCPMCRFDLDSVSNGGGAEGGDGEEPNEHPPVENERNTTLDILSRLDELGYFVPHTFDFDEWSVVRYYCHRNAISCNAALSLIGDDLLPNQVTFVDMFVAPVLWLFDCYQPLINLVPTLYTDYSS